MKIAARLEEARGLCSDIDKDIQQLESLNGARNPERSAEILDHILWQLLHMLRDELTQVSEHYERQLRKKGLR